MEPSPLPSTRPFASIYLLDARHTRRVAVTFDPFAPDYSNDTKYARDKFYTRAYDKQGHTSTVRFEGKQIHLLREQHAMLGEVRLAIPQYRTVEDQVRNYIYHGLVYDKDMKRLSPRNEKAVERIM